MARRDIENAAIGNATIWRRNFGIADCVMASPPTCRLERRALAASARADGRFSQLVEFDTARVISIRSVCISGKSRKIAPRRLYFWIIKRARPSPRQQRHTDDRLRSLRFTTIARSLSVPPTMPFQEAAF